MNPQIDNPNSGAFPPQATPEQQAFIQTLLEGKPCFLSARAGTGKTTTIKWAVQSLRKILKAQGRDNPQAVCAVAFNKANQQDLQKALGIDVQVMTLHGLGFKSLREALPGLDLEMGKVFEILKTHGSKLRKREVFSDTFRLVSCAKNWGLGYEGQLGPWKLKPLVPATWDAWADLKAHFELFNAKEEIAAEVLKESTRQAIEDGQIDFDDMVYLPVLLRLPVWSAERLIVDEAQDLSPLNLALLAKSPSKKWFVGDPFQCIYSWRGAQEDIIQSLGLPELPLTNCWRCSKEIIQEANKWVPDIRTDNPSEGPVQTLTWLPDFKRENPAVILGRRNSELVSLALQLRHSGVQGFIQGKSFVKTLEEILSQLKGSNLTSLLKSLNQWLDRMIESYPHKSGELKDYAECLALFLSEGRSRQAAEKLISESFTDTPAPGAWVLSTIHKAKGREWPRVYGLQWTDKANQPWQRKEERNLHYVAVTRAQKQFTWIAESAWKKEREDWRAPSGQRAQLTNREFEFTSGAFGWDYSGESA